MSRITERIIASCEHTANRLLEGEYVPLLTELAGVYNISTGVVYYTDATIERVGLLWNYYKSSSDDEMYYRRHFRFNEIDISDNGRKIVRGIKQVLPSCTMIALTYLYKTHLKD
ncbi:MAG: hypothetical protein WC222_06860 [Parachlamydiales bacterium]|jgi:hypothetical protein